MHVPLFSLDKQLSEIGQELDAAVLKILQSGKYIGGLEVNAFEKSFAECLHVKHVIGCNSGTDALMLALRALDIGPGDEVITSSFSFFATAEAISNVGAKPIFVDIDPENYLLDLNLLKEAITSSTKAILPVHLFGSPIDMTKLLSFAKENGLKVIEDCAQAVGSVWEGQPVGSIGDIGCFSFFPTKNLGAAGDGGAVATNDVELANRVRELAIHGMPKRYLHTDFGYNSRLDAIQAAILNVKLPSLPKWIKKRQQIAERYCHLLEDLPGIQLPLTIQKDENINSWNQFVIRFTSCSKKEEIVANRFNDKFKEIYNNLPDSSARDWLQDSLQKLGVGTIIYYPIPIHLQPAYKKYNYEVNSLPNTENICSEVLSLPIFPELNLEEQEYVVNSIKNLLE